MAARQALKTINGINKKEGIIKKYLRVKKAKATKESTPKKSK